MGIGIGGEGRGGWDIERERRGFLLSDEITWYDYEYEEMTLFGTRDTGSKRRIQIAEGHIYDAERQPPLVS